MTCLVFYGTHVTEALLLTTVISILYLSNQSFINYSFYHWYFHDHFFNLLKILGYLRLPSWVLKWWRKMQW